MTAPFDAKLIAKLLDVPVIAVTDPKKKCVTFQSARNLALALLHPLNKAVVADTFLVAPGIGFRKREGGVPLVVPGFAPVTDVAARVADGESLAAVATATGTRRTDIARALAFHARWLSGGRAKVSPTPARTLPKLACDPKVTRRAAALPSPEDQVARVIESVGKTKPPRKPVSPATLRTLRLASGAALPRSLAAWLAFDSALAPPHRAGRLVASSLAKLAVALSPALAELELDFDRLPGDCYCLQLGDEQASFLYGTPDADGELAVLVLDAHEREVVLAAPGFDVWLATRHELIANDTLGSLPRTYKRLMTEHARLDLGGKLTLAL